MFIDNISDVAFFFILTLYLFGDYFMGGSAMSTQRRLYKSWYKEYKTLVWLPPRWLFPIAWTIIYLLIEISLYVFYKNVFIGEPVYVVPSITLLFIFNILINKLWSPVFIEMRMTWLAMVMIFAILATGIAMLIIFGLNNYWISLGTFLPYMLWCLFALYLNITVFRAEKKKKKTKSEI